MLRQMARTGSLAAIGLIFGILAVRADTFTSKKTGTVLEGRLLGTATQGGKKMLVVKVGREIRRLPADEWTVAKAEVKPAPTTFTPAKTTEKDTTEDIAEKGPTYKYQGRTVSEEWLKHHHRRFADKIAFVHGRYYDIGKTKLVEPEITGRPLSVGSARLPCAFSRSEGYAEAKVARVLGEDEAIMVRPAIRASRGASGRSEVTFHVTGLEPAQCKEDATFNDWLIYVGTYRDGPTTLQSYMVHKPLTEEQFADALAAGFALVDYEVHELRYHSAAGDRRKTRIIAKPVR